MPYSMSGFNNSFINYFTTLKVIIYKTDYKQNTLHTKLKIKFN